MTVYAEHSWIIVVALGAPRMRRGVVIVLHRSGEVRKQEIKVIVDEAMTDQHLL